MKDRDRKEQKGESCQIYGYFDTNKVPGNFHISFFGAPTLFDLGSSGSRKRNQNLVHTIHELEFIDVSFFKSIGNKVFNGFGDLLHAPLNGLRSEPLDFFGNNNHMDDKLREHIVGEHGEVTGKDGVGAGTGEKEKFLMNLGMGSGEQAHAAPATT